MATLRYGTVIAGALRKWRPMPPPSLIVPVLSVLVALQAINRGQDLIRSPQSTSEINAYVSVIGQNTWGWALLLTGAAVIVSTLFVRRIGALLLSHGLIAAVYVGYSLALAQGLLTTSETLHGTRFVGAAAVAAVFWVVWTLVLIVGMVEQLVGFRVFARKQRAHRDATDLERPPS